MLGTEEFHVHSDVPARDASGRPAPWHVHWFRSAGADPFSSANLYRCRCGQIRPGF